VAIAVLPAAFLMRFDKESLVVLAPRIQQEFHFDLVTMTQILAAYGWFYALFQVPGAWLARRAGPRMAIALCVAAWSLSVFVTPLAGTALAFFLLRAAMGVLQAPDFLSSVIILRQETSGTERARWSAALLGCAYLGSLLSGPVSVEIASRWGWRAAFLLFGAAGVLLSGVLFFRLARQPEANRSSIRDARKELPLRDIVRVPRVHSIALICFFFYGVQSFVYVLLPMYLVDVRGTSLTAVGWLASIPLLALIMAVLSTGFISDAILRRTGSLILARVPAGMIAMTGSATCFSFAISAGNVGGTMGWTCAGMTLVGVGQVILWAQVQDFSEGTGYSMTAWVQILGAVGSAFTSTAAAYAVELTHAWDAVGLVLLVAGIGASLCLLLTHLLPSPPLHRKRA
jgi:MFS family permease